LGWREKKGSVKPKGRVRPRTKAKGVDGPEFRKGNQYHKQKSEKRGVGSHESRTTNKTRKQVAGTEKREDYRGGMSGTVWIAGVIFLALICGREHEGATQGKKMFDALADQKDLRAWQTRCPEWPRKIGGSDE